MFKAIWQAEDFCEKDWLDELFAGQIGEHVYDGTHSLVQDDCIVFDQFIHRKPIEYFQKFGDRTNVFLFHLSDEHYHGGYNAYQYFNGVFRTCWSSVFKPTVKQLPLGYTNGLRASASPKLASGRKYVWSFLGETQRATRPEMVEALVNIKPNLYHPTDQSATVQVGPTVYKNTLEDSIFVPSPMGRLNLECFRTYEALECGCIPIVEKRNTLDFYTGVLGPHPLISIRNWSEAPEIMRRLTKQPEALDAMQAELQSWWKGTKSKLRTEVSQLLERQGQGEKPTDPSTHQYYRLPLWQQIELARHHSAKALIRRARLEAVRLLSPAHRQGSAK